MTAANLLLTALLISAAVLPDALAQDAYPNRPIRIVAPTSPGGGNDIVARLIAQGLSERLGRPVVVENRPGAGTIIGSEIVARSQPDGHTLLMGQSKSGENRGDQAGVNFCTGPAPHFDDAQPAPAEIYCGTSGGVIGS